MTSSTTGTVTGADAARLHIGLTGRMGSGKGEVVHLLEAEGFRYVSLSDMVRNEARRLGRPVNRREMQDIGNRLRKEGGAGVLGEKVAEHIRAHDESLNWVIDGIRNPAEVEALRDLPAFLLLGVDAPLHQIMQRLLSRARETDRMTEAELRARLEREWGENEPPDGQRVGDCMKMADFVLVNDQDLETLTQRLRLWLNSVEVDHE